MGISLNGLFNRMQQQIAYLSGQNFNIYRTNYNQVDQTPQLIASNVRIKCETAGTRFADPRFPIVQYYSIFGDRAMFQPGDLLISQEPGSTTPPVTVIQMSPIEECMGIRTSRICDIGSTTNQIIAHNVHFDFLYVTASESGFQGSFSGSFNKPYRKAILFSRPQLREEDSVPEINGLRLIETDGTAGAPYERWIIKSATPITNLIELELEQEQ